MSEKTTQVERPHIVDAGCWAQVRRYTGSLWPQYSACGRAARRGFHTCASHAYLEADAKRLEAKIAEGRR